MTSVQLRDVCGVRSGDEGDISDPALFADDDETYDLLRSEVLALKFVPRGALGGGGRSVRNGRRAPRD